MDFFRKVKNFVTGQTDAPSTSGRSSEPDVMNSGAVHSRATVTYRQPVLQNAGFGTAGGVQGLDWYKANLKQDKDGDLADEFLSEQSKQSNTESSKGLKAQKRHLKQPADASVLVQDGNVYLVPKS